MYHRLIALSICSILILACGFAICAPTKTEPPKPIPTGPDCYTQAKYDAAVEKVHYRTIVDAYRQVGVRDPKWDDKAVGLLEGFAKHRAKSKDAPSPSELYGQAKVLIDLGCTDPMIQYAYAITCKLKRDYDAMDKHLVKAQDGFEKTNYPRVQARLAPLELLRFHKAWRINLPEDSRSLELLREWNVGMLSDGSFLPGEERIAVSWLLSPLDDFPYPGRLDLYEAVKKRPGVDPYVLNTVGGRCHLREGWRLRGEGWGYQISEEGWKGFEEQSKEAYKLFLAAWKLHPEYPEAPTGLMEIAMIGVAPPEDSVRLWFDRALAAQMDYIPAYDEYFRSLLPRWGGSHEEIYGFGVECLKTGRFDTHVPSQFSSALNHIASDVDPDRSYMRKPETAKHLKEMMDGYEKTGLMGGVERCRTLKALYLWSAGHYPDAKLVMDELGDRADKSVAQENFGTSLDKVREELAVLGVEPGLGLAEVQKLYDGGEPSKALVACKQVLAKCAGMKLATEYARNWFFKLNTEAEMAKGGWVNITPETDFAAWSKDSGEWIKTDDGAVQGTSDKADAKSALSSRVNVGSHFELKGEFHYVTPKDANVSAVITFDGSWRNVRVAFPLGMTQIDIDWVHANWGSAAGHPVYQEHNTFAIRYWEGKMSIDVNGKSMGGPFICNPDKGKEKSLLADPQVGVVLSAISSKGGCTVKFNNLQVRQLTQIPADIAKKVESK